MSLDTFPVLHDPARLAALRRVALLDTPAEEAFDRLTRLATAVLEVPVALVSLVDEERQFFKSQCGLPEPWASDRETPLSHSFCQHVVATQEPLIVSDARKHAWVQDNLAIPDIGVIAYAGVPLISSDGYELGSFCAIDSTPRDWTQREVAILKDLAASAMTEIELRTEVVQRRAVENALRKANEELVMLTGAADTARERAEQAVRERNEVIGIVTHDLRNPLHSISITLDVLRHVPLSEEAWRKRLDIIGRTVDQMDQLIGSLLDVRRIEARQALAVAPRKMEAAALIQEGCELFQPQVEEKRIRLAHKIPPDLPLVLADPERIIQVFWNLISNAVKFTPEDGDIEVGCEIQSDSVWFRVSDSGPGIPAEHLDLIFDPFWQDQSMAHTGTGLGLSIAKAIVEAHRGRIGVESRPGHGATFFFTLPAG